MNIQQHPGVECGQWSAGYKVSALLIAAFGFVGYLFTSVYGLLALAVLPLLTFIYLYLEIDFERRFSDYIAFFRRHPELGEGIMERIDLALDAQVLHAGVSTLGLVYGFSIIFLPVVFSEGWLNYLRDHGGVIWLWTISFLCLGAELDRLGRRKLAIILDSIQLKGETNE